MATSGAEANDGAGNSMAAQKASTIWALRREASLPMTDSGMRGYAAAS